MKLQELSLLEKMTINGGWYGPFNPEFTAPNYYKPPTFIHHFNAMSVSSSPASAPTSIAAAPAMATPVASLFSAPTVVPSVSNSITSALSSMFASVFG